MSSLIIAILYVCQSTGPLACYAGRATEPPRVFLVTNAACGYYSLNGGSAFMDCGRQY